MRPLHRRRQRILPAAALAAICLGLVACAVDNSFDPVPPAGRREIYGDLRISTQLEADNLKGIRRIVGDLEIYGQEIHHLNGLVDLQQVTGSFVLRSSPHIPDLEPLGNLREVETFRIWGCDRIKTLDLIRNIDGLTWLAVSDCDSLTSLPSGSHLWEVAAFEAGGLPQLASLDFLQHLTRVVDLKLQDLPAGLDYGLTSRIGSLGQLRLSRLPITALPDLSQNTILNELILDELPNLTTLTGVAFPSLQELTVEDCPLLTSLAGIGPCPDLRRLNLRRCHGLTELGLENVGSEHDWTILSIKDCDGLVDLTGLSAEWRTLDLDDCDGITGLGGIPDASALRNLQIYDLPNLADLTGLPAGLPLSNATIRYCPQLSSVAGLTLGMDAQFNLAGATSLATLAGMTVSAGLWRLDISGSAVTDLTALATVDTIHELVLAHNSTTSLTGLEGLRRVSSRLECRNNLSLADASALAGILTADGWRIEFSSNPLLDTCVLEGMVAGWDVEGDVIIENNGPCAE